jgi:hypothetical protein
MLESTETRPHALARRLRRWWPGLVLAALLVALFPDVFIRGWVISANDILYQYPPFNEDAPPGFRRAHNPLLGDQPYFFYPARAFLREQVRQGVWPWWIPYILGGHSFVLTISTQIFHPMQLLVWVLPQTVGETIYALLKLLAGGVGMLVFLRRWGVATEAALAGGLAFMACAYNIVWLNHPHSSVATMLPWCFWLIEEAFQRRHGVALTLLAGGAVFYLVMAGGHPNTIINCVFLGGLYTAYRFLAGGPGESWRRRWHAVALVAGALALGVMLSGVFLAPFGMARLSREYSYGGRQRMAQLAAPLPAREYLPLLMPLADGSPVTGDDRHLYNFNENGLFVGLAMLVPQILALPWLLRRRDWRFLLAICVLVVLTLQNMTPIGSVIRYLPLLRDNPLQRISLLLQFALAAGGGIAWHVLASRPTDRRHRVLIGASAVLLTTAGLFFTWTLHSARGYGWFVMGLVGSAVAAAALPWMSRPSARAWLLGAVCVLVALELWAANAGYNPTLPRSVAEVPVPRLARELKEELARSWHRIAAVDYETLPPQSAAWIGLNDVRGGEIPLWLRYFQFGWAYPPLQMRIDWTTDRLADPRWRRFLELMGVRHVLVTDRNGTRTVRLSGALPHVFWAEKLRRSTDDLQQNLEILRDGQMIAELPATHEPRDGAGPLSIRPIDVNTIGVEAEVTRPGVLVLNEMAARGWRARVDGQPAPVIPINIAHGGVWLEPGRHTVEFAFRPRGVVLGGAMSLAGLTAMLVLAVVAWRSRTTDR